MLPITYIRSSSYGSWELCPHSYLLGYPLNIAQSSFKAERGCLTHKALELLAHMKVALQNGKKTFSDQELGGTWKVKGFEPDKAFDLAVEHYVPNSEFSAMYTRSELKIYRQWMHQTLHFNDGICNPLNREVIWPEKHFDFEIDEPWATYDYLMPDGSRLQGKLRIKGTMDLICAVERKPKMVENLDWKTGKRLDWATGEVKTIKKLRDDFQLRLYHYAICRLLPEIEQVLVTIVYSQAHDNPSLGLRGGPYTLPPFTNHDHVRTLQLIRDKFEEIRDSDKPELKKGWKCTSFCYYGKNKQESTGKTICQHFDDELSTLGMDRLLQKHGNIRAMTNYQGGGGMANRDTQSSDSLVTQGTL